MSTKLPWHIDRRDPNASAAALYYKGGYEGVLVNNPEQIRDELNSVAVLENRVAVLESALTELVACKDLKERMEVTSGPVELISLAEEYARRKPLAWSAARDAIAKRAP